MRRRRRLHHVLPDLHLTSGPPGHLELAPVEGERRCGQVGGCIPWALAVEGIVGGEICGRPVHVVEATEACRFG